MANEFTQAQQRAIDSDAREICVSAGAGAGKTGVLVARYLRLITEASNGEQSSNNRPSVYDILVITFTDRATREMKYRIVRELINRNMIEERRQLETSYISTIHSFCARMLRENPFDAGIDPGFTVLDESTSKILLHDAFHRSVDRAFSNARSGMNGSIVELTKAYSLRVHAEEPNANALAALATEVQEMLSRFRCAGVTRADLLSAVSRSFAVEQPESLFQPVQILLDPVLANLSTAMIELGLINSSMVRGAVSGITHLKGVVSRLKWGSNALEHVRNVQTLHAAAEHSLAMLATTEYGAVRLLFDNIRTICGPIAFLFGEPTVENAPLASTSRGVLSLLNLVWEEFDKSKRDSSLLDNEDLQTECVRLLSTCPEVLSRAQMQFKHILVDEFQDINPLQLQLIELLHGSVISNSYRHMSSIQYTNVSRNSLFMVGDIHQSIYGFRNADPEIFASIEKTFREKQSGEYLSLNDNFRSRPEILQLVNLLFSQIWQYEASTFMPLNAKADFSERHGPSLEFMVSQDASRRDYVLREATAIARRVQQIVIESGLAITLCSNPDHGRYVKYGDIAILLRGLPDVATYEAAFAELGIATVLAAGGRGYYARLEIQDILNFLTVLDSPLDDIALLATIRSPFVGISLDAIYLLAQHAKSSLPLMGENTKQQSIPLYSALSALTASFNIERSDRVKLQSFLELLHSLQSLVDTVPVSLLLERLISATGYDLRLLCRPHGKRMLANVRKLIQIAHANPELRLSEFIGQMRTLEKITDREGDAPMAEDGSQAVRLMTMHAAKGLEFPIVVLPDISRGMATIQHQMFACEPSSYAVGSSLSGTPDIIYRAIEFSKHNRDKSEYLRLLYVAMTRTREYLIVCGNIGRNRANNWGDAVFPILGISSVPAEPEIRNLRGNIQARITPIGPLPILTDQPLEEGSDKPGECSEWLNEFERSLI